MFFLAALKYIWVLILVDVENFQFNIILLQIIFNLFQLIMPFPMYVFMTS